MLVKTKISNIFIAITQSANTFSYSSRFDRDKVVVLHRHKKKGLDRALFTQKQF